MVIPQPPLREQAGPGNIRLEETTGPGAGEITRKLD